MTEPTKTRSPRRDWRRIMLPASIVLNLFLAALVVSHLLRAGSDAGAQATPLARTIAQAVATLSPNDATAFRAVMRRDAPHYLGAAQQLADARLDLDRQITTEPFDPAAVTTALSAWQVQWNRFTTLVGPTIVDALGHISPDGRRQLVAERRRVSPTPRMP